MPDTHDERGPFRNDLRSQLVAAGTEAAEQWLAIRANRKMSDVNRKRLAGHVVNALWAEIERAVLEMASYFGDDQLAAANERADLAEAQVTEIQADRHEWQRRAQRGHAVAEILRANVTAATARAEKAEARVAHLDKARDAAVRAWKSEHDAADALQAERDTVVRLLGQFVDHEDGPCRFDHHGACQEHGSDEGPCATDTARQFLATVRGDAKAPDASSDGRSEPVERSETSGGIGDALELQCGLSGAVRARACARHLCVVLGIQPERTAALRTTARPRTPAPARRTDLDRRRHDGGRTAWLRR
jgi:hypothetical protein